MRRRQPSSVPQLLAGSRGSACRATSTTDRGHPFSHCDVEPLNLWQRIIEHRNITLIVEFAAGSAGLAIAASGAAEYEGIGANDIHREWLVSKLDRVATYLAGKGHRFREGVGQRCGVP